MEEAFLVHKSGCLIGYHTKKSNVVIDYDIVVGMLTAIQSFVKETFGDGKWALKRLEFENKNIMIELGENFYLAIVYAGKATAKMNYRVEKTMKNIEEKYGYLGANWNGDMDIWAGTMDLVSCMFSEGDHETEEVIKCPLCGAIVEENTTTCHMCEFDFSLMNN